MECGGMPQIDHQRVGQGCLRFPRGVPEGFGIRIDRRGGRIASR